MKFTNRDAGADRGDGTWVVGNSHDRDPLVVDICYCEGAKSLLPDVASGIKSSRRRRIVTATTSKRIVCLANSRKMSGRCIAGKEFLENGRIGEWIRPVSARDNEEVSEDERQYEDGSDPQVLDVIDVPVLNAQPKNYQQENWLLDPVYYWKKVRRVAWNEVEQLTDSVAPLWTNGINTLKGKNDQIPLSIANTLDSSLRLKKVDTLELSVSAPGADFGDYRRRLQGRFRHDNVNYWLVVTDPIYSRKYLQSPNDIYRIGDSFLTISIGEPFHGHAYKLIAAIIEPS